MKSKKKLKEYIKPELIEEKITLSTFFDSRSVDSLPSLFMDDAVLLAQSGGGGGCCTNSHGCACLLPQTLIQLQNGKEIFISHIKEADILFDGTTQGARVIAIYAHIRHDGYIEINNGLIESSIDHEFWAENKQAWVKAQNLNIHDQLLNAHNKKVLITSIKRINKVQLVYNIELELHKSFFYANGIKTHVMRLLPSTNSNFWQSV